MKFYWIIMIFLLTLTSVSAYSTSNLIAYYNFDAPSNETWIDIHNNYDLLLTTSGSSENPYNYSTTFQGNIFNGNIGTFRTDSFRDLSNKSFSINMWLNYSVAHRTIFGISNNINFYGMVVQINNSIDTLSNTIYSGTFQNEQQSILNINGWKMLTLTYDYTLNKITWFVNGIEAYSFNVTVSNPFPTIEQVFYIADASNMMIDEYSVWNESLSQSSINTLYNHGIGLNYSQTLSPPIQPIPIVYSLVSYYDFEQSNFSEIIDATGNYNINCTYGCEPSRNSSAVNGIEGLGLLDTTYNGFFTDSLANSFQDLSGKSFTANTWFRYDSGNNGEIFGFSSNMGGISATVNGQSLTIAYYDETDTYNTILASNILREDYWNMVTVTYNNSNGNMRIYVDGDLMSNIFINTASGLFPSPHFFEFDLPNIILDEYSIWNTTLNNDEINNLYNFGDGLNYTETLEEFSQNITPATSYSINYTNNSIIIGNGFFSKSQCVNIGNGQDYVCTDSIYNPVDNGFYCNTINSTLTPCGTGKVCMTFLYDVNTSEQLTFNLLRSCSQIVNTLNYSVFSFGCTRTWNIDPLTGSVLNLLYTAYGYDCSEIKQYNIPTTTCTDTPQWDFIRLRENDSFYTEGQCQATGCVNNCSLNTYDCANSYQPEKCVLMPNGCYGWNITDFCSGQYRCQSGGCVFKEINSTGTGSTNSDFFNGSGLSTGMKYLLVIVTLIVLIAGFTVAGYQMNSGKMGMIIGLIFAIFGFIGFVLLGWIPAWILIVLIIISIAVIFLVGRGNSNNSGGM